MTLTKEELMEIQGGGFGKYLFGAIAAIGLFLAGVFDGYTRPYTCR